MLLYLIILELLAVSILLYLVEHGKYEYNISIHTNKHLTFLGGLYYEAYLLPLRKKLLYVVLSPIVLLILLVYFITEKEIRR